MSGNPLFFVQGWGADHGAVSDTIRAATPPPLLVIGMLLTQFSFHALTFHILFFQPRAFHFVFGMLVLLLLLLLWVASLEEALALLLKMLHSDCDLMHFLWILELLLCCEEKKYYEVGADAGAEKMLKDD